MPADAPRAPALPHSPGVQVEYQEQQARLAAARKKEGAALARGTGAADSGGEDDEPAVPRGGGARFV